jgi:hypothetical protein
MNDLGTRIRSRILELNYDLERPDGKQPTRRDSGTILSVRLAIEEFRREALRIVDEEQHENYLK